MNRRSRLYALSFALIVALSPMATDLYLPAIPQIAESLVADIQVVELSISTYMLGVAAGQLLAAPVSDRVGRKPIILAGLALFLLSTIATVTVESAPNLLTLRFLQGLGAGAAVVNVMAAVGDLYEERDAARMFSTIHIIVLTAPLIAPIIGAALVIRYSWQANFAFLGFYAVAVILIAILVVPETVETPPAKGERGSIAREIAEDYRQVLARPQAALFNLTIALAFACFLVFLTDAAFVYLEWFGAATMMFPVLFGANIVLMMIGNRVNVYLLGRFRPRKLIPWGHGLQVVATAALLFYAARPSQTLLVFVPLVMLATSANTFIIGNTTARYISLFKTRRGTASAVSGVIQFSLGASLVVGISLVHDGTPRTMAAGMLGCAAAAALCSAAIAWAERNGTRAAAQ